MTTPLPDVAQEIMRLADEWWSEGIFDGDRRAALEAKVTELAASRDGWANSWQVCDADRQQLKAALAEMTAHRDKLRDAIRWYGDGDKRADAILLLEEAQKDAEKWREYEKLRKFMDGKNPVTGWANNE